MPQISLYIDAKTLRKVEMAAEMAQMSISKYVASSLAKSVDENWPENYFNLFGSIQDETFAEPEKLDFGHDNQKEIL